MKYRLIIIKLMFITFCFFCLYLELKSYNNMRGSMGEYMLLNHKSIMHSIAYASLSIPTIIWLFSKNRILSILMIGFILFILLFFYPIFDMTGVENPM
ncbi:MAG: hypothetical protein K0S23_1167 [Fluviicola sp.]|jgi:membrane-bound metal-dependent hydrolase YbcI (DUF457 family)|nr:hypothetical protein [Fluviicola sp.]